MVMTRAMAARAAAAEAAAVAHANEESLALIHTHVDEQDEGHRELILRSEDEAEDEDMEGGEITNYYTEEPLEDMSISPANIEFPPGLEDKMMGLIDEFFANTAHLATQNNIMQAQQCNLAAAQNTALMAMKASADSEVQRLAAFQDSTKFEMHGALNATREAMREDLMNIVQMQQHQGAHIEQILSERIAKSFAEAQREAIAAQHMAFDQARRNKQIEGEIAAAVEELRMELKSVAGRSQTNDAEIALHIQAATSSIEQELSDKLENLVSKRFTDHQAATQNGHPTNRCTTQRIQTITGRAVMDAEARLEQQLQEMMANAQEKLSADAKRREEAVIEVIQDSVAHEVMDAESRLEAQLQARMMKCKKANEEALKKQAVATDKLKTDMKILESGLTDKLKSLEKRVSDLEIGQSAKRFATISQAPVDAALKTAPQKGFASKRIAGQADPTSQALDHLVASAAAQLTDMIDRHLCQKEGTTQRATTPTKCHAKPACAAVAKGKMVPEPISSRGKPKKKKGAEFRKAVAAKEQELIALRAEVAARRHESANC